jgi:hypothetical protein
MEANSKHVKLSLVPDVRAPSKNAAVHGEGFMKACALLEDAALGPAEPRHFDSY